MQKIKDDIKNRNFKNVYLLFGDEDYLKNDIENKLKKAIISPDSEMMNFDLFQESNVDVQKIKDACETFPFMSDFRMIIVRESELFTTGKKYETEKMAEYIKNISKTTVIIFTEKKVDKRNKLFKVVSDVGYCAECKNLSEKDMITWIGKLACKKGLSMSSDVIRYFVRSTGSNMNLAVTEMQKLSDYIEKGQVSTEDIDNICTKPLEVKIFDMVAAIGNKDVKSALDIYNNMIFMKESPLMILSMIARQFRLILQSKYLQEKGFYKTDIAKEIGQREFVVSNCLSQGRNFKKTTLMKALEDCLQCDVDIKTGKIQDVIGVETLILKYGS